MVLDIVSFGISIMAFGVALAVYLVSKKAYGIQSFSRYFDINNFVMDNWEVLSAFGPLGQCKNKNEVIIRLFLYHRLNPFRLEEDKDERKKHVEFSKTTFGKNIKEFCNILKQNGATEEVVALAPRILKEIYEKETYFDDVFWNEFFDPGYSCE